MERKGYTLIELLIVIAIVGIMAGIGIPGFAAFGKNSVFQQKISEIKSAMNQVYYLSRNPEDSIVKYYELTKDPEDNLVFRRCDQIDESKNCAEPPKEVKGKPKISLLKGESWSSSSYVKCFVGPNSECTFGVAEGAPVFSFYDSNDSVDKAVNFTVEMPKFNVNVVLIDN